MKIYCPEDNSLIEYFSNNRSEFDEILPNSSEVKEYARFCNKDYELVAKVEEKITKHGHLNSTSQSQQIIPENNIFKEI